MRFKLFGRKNKKTIVLIHPECARWNIFESAIPILSREYRIIIPVLAGYDDERPDSVFVSAEKCASSIEKYLVSSGQERCECIYGCSLGGAIAALIAAGKKAEAANVVIDGTSAPLMRPRSAAKAAAAAEWTEIKSDRRVSLDGVSAESAKKSLFSARNYNLPARPVNIKSRVRYWFCGDNDEENETNAAFWESVFPGIEIEKNPGNGKAGFLTDYNADFCKALLYVINPESAKAGLTGTAAVAGLYARNRVRSDSFGRGAAEGGFVLDDRPDIDYVRSDSFGRGAAGYAEDARAAGAKGKPNSAAGNIGDVRGTRAAEAKKKSGGRNFAREKKLAEFFFITPIIFFAMFFFLECLLRALNSDISFFGAGLLRCFFSAAAASLFLWFVTSIIPNKTVSAVIAAVFMGFAALFICIEAGLKIYFGSYFQISYVFSMSTQVAGNFGGDIWQLFTSHIPQVILAIAPCILVILLRKILFPETKVFRKFRFWALQAGLLILVFLLNVGICLVGDSAYYTSEFAPNTAIAKFGILNTLRLELKYSIFGMPKAELKTDEAYIKEVKADENSETADANGKGSEGEEGKGEGEGEGEEETAAIEYGDNVLDIDFDALIASDTDNILLAMDEYFSSQTPTKKNEYTGLFEGKNLIMITAEAFSYAVIDKDRTPALYELANNGVVCTNFYQPDWSQSTTGGEFSHMTGIIPTWIDGQPSFGASAYDAMPFALGWIFKAEGYSTKAYHNHYYNYYDRDVTHPNLGYDYEGIGNGLVIESSSEWPASDLEMLEATIDEDIEAYVNDGTLFHTYYMSVSGHGDYGWGDSAMSRKNREYIESLGLDYSEPVLAYLAAQQELEYALEYLLSELDEAGIAEDTVIVMVADHYPYLLTLEEEDYYKELIGREDLDLTMTEYYKNTLILWSGCIDEPIVTDTPCTAVDVVPTLLNLFGIDYDSRLLSGRDILSPDVEAGTVDSNMHIAYFTNMGYGTSWITAAGTYEAYTQTFTPAEGVELEDEEAYVAAVAGLVENKYTYAYYLISENYYAHVFPYWSGGMKLTEALALSSDS